MPGIAAHCHELRIKDEDSIWRIMYRIDTDAIIILEVFKKKSAKTPKRVLDVCKLRLKVYDRETK
jgi:phage-related protein